MTHRIQDDGVRHKVTGVVRNLRTRQYSLGSMLLFDFEDTSGSIPVVVWNDAYDKFVQIFKLESTYTIHNVQGKTNARNNNRMELKLYPDTRTDAAIPLKLTENYRTICDILSQPDLPVRAKVIVYNVGDVETMTSSEKMRRCVFADASGETTGFIVGDDAVSKHIVDGASVRIVGRMSQKTNLFANSIEAIDDDQLSAFWSASSGTHLAKRAKLNASTATTIAELAAADAGSSVKLTAVVRSSSLAPASVGDRIKHECTIVDRTMHAIDLAQFCEKDTPCAWTMGDVIRVDAKVSPYKTKSLTCNEVSVVDDSDLSSWFADLDVAAAVFTELTQFH